MRLPCLAAMLTLALACAAPAARAQTPLEDSLRHAPLVPPPQATVPARADSVPPPPAFRAPLPRDTARVAPHVMTARPWLEFGAGWVGGPADLAHLYQASQGLGAGLEFQPRRGFALRMAADYQMLVAREDAKVPVFVLGSGGTVDLDTVSIQFDGNAWIAQARFEAGCELPGDFRLTAGVGGGYMNGGFSDNVGTPGSFVSDVLVERIVRNAWGWSWTSALRWDFEPAPEAPLGIDVRHTAFVRNDATLHTWSVRLCYRMPDRKAHRPPDPRDPHRY